MSKSIDTYEWSESGLKMLKDIENSIKLYGGRGRLLFSLVNEQHKGYACNKEDCDFCDRFKLKTLYMPESKNSYLKRPLVKLQTKINMRNFKKNDNSFNY